MVITITEGFEVITITNSCSILMTEMAVVESSPLVGSSRNNTPGDTINSIPMATRFLCPPDTPRVNGVPI